MPELRKDPVVGRWVIIATERARRPGNIVDSSENTFNGGGSHCPFCHNKEKVIYTAKNDKHPDWSVLVVPSGAPTLKPQSHSSRTGHGLYDVINGYGAHEVIIETPEHIANMADLDVEQIQQVLNTYVVRINDLKKDPNLQYALSYKNHGWGAGGRRIGHSRSQIVATPVNPLRVKEKLIGAKKYFDYHERCVYCDLINQEKEFKKRIIFETEHFIAMTPFAARFLFEIWVLPKKHDCDFSEGVVGFEEDLARILKDLLLKIKIGLNDPAYNYVIHSAPFRREHDKKLQWKTIHEDYHWHMEIMPRLTRVAGFEKGTGFYICPVPPENMAEFLREVEIYG
ncbi:MAG: hypothetical protein A2787_05450 [Omnitrophica WOR_2 bacterium RIFCSPHIGHO2_01_FULL_48_9]|nr:MAG: hypothetical protein A3D10_03190 [Omnitrophica WOR_2 bacterium RIFCSPHIGHO2_02_FULL_48_11]OGX33403.1 MAG: hypothetical protein A2787_05450 [Omnitrophica WOR_2 bacterium RIFCSPHIGHO2_01_FULL_48_9]